MTQNQISELLSQQADRLNGSLDKTLSERAATTETVQGAGLAPDEQRLLGELMQLARRVQAGLVDVEPRPAFAADLKARLIGQGRAVRATTEPAGHGMLWVAGVAGALSLAGLGFLSYRVARAGAGWISAATSGHNARPALPKA